MPKSSQPRKSVASSGKSQNRARSPSAEKPPRKISSATAKSPQPDRSPSPSPSRRNAPSQLSDEELDEREVAETERFDDNRPGSWENLSNEEKELDESNGPSPNGEDDESSHSSSKAGHSHYTFNSPMPNSPPSEVTSSFSEIQKLHQLVSQLAQQTAAGLSATATANSARAFSLTQKQSVNPSPQFLANMLWTSNKPTVSLNEGFLNGLFPAIESSIDLLQQQEKKLRHSKAGSQVKIYNENLGSLRPPSASRMRSSSVTFKAELENLKFHHDLLVATQSLILQFRNVYADEKLPELAASSLVLIHVAVQQMLLLINAREQELIMLSSAKTNDARDQIRDAYKERFNGTLSAETIAERKIITKALTQQKAIDSALGSKKPFIKSTKQNKNKNKDFKPAGSGTKPSSGKSN